jgi:Ca2+-transporting ATPase
LDCYSHSDTNWNTECICMKTVWRIVESSQLEVNESLLTGESVPVEKDIGDLPENTILGDQKNMFFKATSATRGNAKIVVTSTGMKTQIGQIHQMMEEAQMEEIPLNKKLNKLSHRLIGLTLFIILVFVAVGYYTGRDLYLMIETAIALAVAAIPEGLPIVATIALAKGMLNGKE